jgi:hypothetical protein
MGRKQAGQKVGKRAEGAGNAGKSIYRRLDSSVSQLLIYRSDSFK